MLRASVSEAAFLPDCGWLIDTSFSPARTTTPLACAIHMFPFLSSAIDLTSALGGSDACGTKFAPSKRSRPSADATQTSPRESTNTCRGSRVSNSVPTSPPLLDIRRTLRVVASQMAPLLSSAIDLMSSPANRSNGDPASDEDLNSAPLNRASPLSVPNHIQPSLSWKIERTFFEGRLGTEYRVTAFSLMGIAGATSN